MVRQCSVCGEYFPPTTEYFYAAKCVSGLDCACKECRKERGRLDRRSRYQPHPRYRAPEGLKRCSKCEKELPATTEYFGPQKNGLYGLRGDCRSCKQAHDRDYVKRTYTKRNRSMRISL